MGNLADDIIKYKKGELSPKQMHALEKRALSDQLLADALEGIETISVENLTNDITSINKKIPENKRTAFTPLRIAAGVILVATSVLVIYLSAPKRENLALADKPKSSALKSEVKKEDQKPQKENAPVKSKASKGVAKKLSNESGVPAPARSAPDIRHVAKIENPPVVPPIQQSPIAEEPQVEKNSGDVAKVETAESERREIATKNDVASGQRPAVARKKELAASTAQASARVSNQKFIAGRVMADDRSPLPGVTVILKGTSQGTVTDEDGNFRMQTDSINKLLEFSFVGFQTQDVSAADRKQVDVLMKDDVAGLSEVVVVGYGASKKSDEEPVMKWAEPEGGRKAYDQYLESNLRYSEEALAKKIKGKAGIEFTVGIDGSLSEFVVFKKLGYGCEEEVIRLVKEGPRWKPTTEDDKPVESTVRIRMRFNAAKTGK